MGQGIDGDGYIKIKICKTSVVPVDLLENTVSRPHHRRPGLFHGPLEICPIDGKGLELIIFFQCRALFDSGKEEHPQEGPRLLLALAGGGDGECSLQPEAGTRPARLVRKAHKGGVSARQFYVVLESVRTPYRSIHQHLLPVI